MCEFYNKQYEKTHNLDYRSLMPTNLFGYGDNYDLNDSHVIPALIRKIHEAKIKNKKNVSIWGTGNPKREFLHVDDLANACFFIMKFLNSNDIYDKNVSHINIGSGEEISIKVLAELIKKIIKYEGELTFDISKPDGMPRKLLDSSRLNVLKWNPKIKLREGIKQVYKSYQENI